MLTCNSLSHGPFMTHSADKVALVTGAARGIGLATAKRFLAEGWRVALLDIEDKLLQGALAALACPDRTLALSCDVADSAGGHRPQNAARRAAERRGPCRHSAHG